MRKSKKILIVTTAFITVIMLAAYFFSGTIYYYSHKKVTIDKIYNGYISKETDIALTVSFKEITPIIFPVYLGTPLVIENIYFDKNVFMKKGDVLIKFNLDSYLLARNSLYNADDKKKLEIFDTLIDDKACFIALEDGFYTNSYLKVGVPFFGACGIFDFAETNSKLIFETNTDVSYNDAFEVGKKITIALFQRKSDESNIIAILNNKNLTDKGLNLQFESQDNLSFSAIERAINDGVDSVKASWAGNYNPLIVSKNTITDSGHIFILREKNDYLGNIYFVEKIEATVIESNDEFYAIESNLTGNELIITSELDSLFDGEEVVVQNLEMLNY